MANFYPSVEGRALNALTTIKQMLESDPGYFTDPDCPYEDELKETLTKLLEPKIIEVPVEKIVERIVERKVEVAAMAAADGGHRGPRARPKAGNAEMISKELQIIAQDIRDLKLNSKTLQPADKVQIIKTQAALVEKMLVMEERNTNIKKMSHFMSTIMGLLDDIMNEDQRQNFMKRLEPFASEE